MKIDPTGIRLSATDLSNHLACRHLTSLDLSVARKERTPPDWRSPDLFVIQELGLRHESDYLNFLRQKGASVEDLRGVQNEEQALLQTRLCMERGTEIIAQGSLTVGRWFGRPDVLQKVPKPSRFGRWSYEVYDCKLAQETKAATILQLALYSAVLTEIQGEEPEFMYVVPAGRGYETERYRLADYAAYYRYVKAQLEKACGEQQGEVTYPEPCVHCDVCRWFRECDLRRRADDHLSLVAGVNRLQRKQLHVWQTDTMADLAVLPTPLQQKPVHGSKDGYERIREQARVQVAARVHQAPVYELLPASAGAGFYRLPEPSPLDIFMDLEGDPFAADGGRQYLFGFATSDIAVLLYQKRWCFKPDEEKQAFEWIVDEIMRKWNAAPKMHV